LEQFLSIDVFGQTYRFKAGDESDNAQAVADFLAREIHDVESQLADEPVNIEKQAILILTALNISSKYLKLEKNHGELSKEIGSRSLNLISTIDRKCNYK
jgi:cell division protein ZapA (FtsZ GTPase activity inhibitor)